MPFIKNKFGVWINTIRTLPHKRYVAALIRIRDQIKGGSKLELDDSDELGNKHTECSWGLCSASKKQWPNEDDRLFPRDHPLSILHRTKGQDCPMDEQKDRKDGPGGCFFSCRIFQNQNNLPSREEAIRLYEIQIKKAKN